MEWSPERSIAKGLARLEYLAQQGLVALLLGQTVRLRLSGLGARLQGEVWALDAEDATVTVLLRFDNVPDEFRGLLFEHLFGDPTELSAVRVDIVLGPQSLFRQVFGRTG